jgi:DNA-binding XRE family transcriptional regulator
MLKNKLEKYRLELSLERGIEIKQNDFAKNILHVGQSQYNRWARQEVQPSLELAFWIALQLKCKIEDLFEYTHPKQDE